MEVFVCGRDLVDMGDVCCRWFAGGGGGGRRGTWTVLVVDVGGIGKSGSESESGLLSMFSSMVELKSMLVLSGKFPWSSGSYAMVGSSGFALRMMRPCLRLVQRN